MLGLEPRELMRKQEKAFRENGLASREALIAGIVTHPQLIECPIVIKDDQVDAIGWLPEALLDLL